MRKVFALFVGVFGLVLFALPASGALSADSSQTYIVQMLPNPVVTYAGGISGLPATKPGKGKKIDPSSGDVTKYADYLKGKHDQALSNVGGGQKLYDYVYSLNGFAAKLTEGQATRLNTQKNVLAVSPDEIQTIQTSSTPHFLGLDVKGGLWDQLGGVSKGGLNKGAGEDEVIGVIDSGAWPESQSFSDRKLDGSNGNNYPHKVTGFSGACQTGEQWTASNCNNKLISARYFNAGTGRQRGHRRRLCRGSSLRHATTTATVRTRRRPPAATSAFSRPVTPPLQASRRSAAWRRVPASRRTRHCGRRRTARRQVGRTPTSSRPSTKPSRTEST